MTTGGARLVTRDVRFARSRKPTRYRDAQYMAISALQRPRGSVVWIVRVGPGGGEKCVARWIRLPGKRQVRKL